MKNLMFFVFALLLLSGCTGTPDEPVNEIEGYWEMVYTQWTDDEGRVNKNIFEKDHRMVKSFGKKNFMFVRMFPDSTGLQTWGAKGTYAYEDGIMAETIDFWEWDLGGYPIRYNIEFRGDSMIQSGPININELSEDWQDVKLYEVYIRIE